MASIAAEIGLQAAIVAAANDTGQEASDQRADEFDARMNRNVPLFGAVGGLAVMAAAGIHAYLGGSPGNVVGAHMVEGFLGGGGVGMAAAFVVEAGNVLRKDVAAWFRDVRAASPGKAEALERGALDRLARIGVEVPDRAALSMTDGKVYLVREAGSAAMTAVSRKDYDLFVARHAESGVPLLTCRTSLDGKTGAERMVVRRTVAGILQMGDGGEPSLQALETRDGETAVTFSAWHDAGRQVARPRTEHDGPAADAPRQ